MTGTPTARTEDDSAVRAPLDGVRTMCEAAAALAGLGVRRGDTVALMVANRPEFHVVEVEELYARS